MVDVPIGELFVFGELRVYPEVVSKKYFEIDLKGDHLVLRAGSFIGLIPLNPRIAIDVRPRIPISNLSRLLRISGQAPVAVSPHLRDYGLDPDADDSLIDHFAVALLDGVREIEFQGLIRRYGVVEADTSMPRGRIQMSRTIVRHASRHRLDRVAATWFEATVDTSENRCLKFALWLLAQQYNRMQARKGSRRILQQLASAYRIFDGVDLDADLAFLSDAVLNDLSRLPRLRYYYAHPLEVALAVIRHQSIRLDEIGHQLRLASLVIDMDRVFEAYVRETLRRGLVEFGAQVLDGNRQGPGFGGKLLFDAQPSEQASPDIVVQALGAIAASAILDAKYKPVTGFSGRSDINQAIAYGLSYRCNEVVLVHPCPRDTPKGITLLGSIGALRVHQYRIDLAAADLAAEEASFVTEMQKLISKPAKPQVEEGAAIYA